MATRQLEADSKNPPDMGTIRREDLERTRNPQRLYVRELSMKLDAQWVTGFVDGEGCFHVGLSRHREMRVGIQVLPEFTVVQHRRDIQVLHALKAYFGCGVVRVNHGDRMAFRVRKTDDLVKRIVPFFAAHPLKTKKHVDFMKFCRVLALMEKGAHLTGEGVDQIRAIASKMNRGSMERESDATGSSGESSR